MHECPECGQACDCDGEDTWFDFPYNLNCTHDCEPEKEDYNDDLRPASEVSENSSLDSSDAELPLERKSGTCPLCTQEGYLHVIGSDYRIKISEDETGHV